MGINWKHPITVAVVTLALSLGGVGFVNHITHRFTSDHHVSDERLRIEIEKIQAEAEAAHDELFHDQTQQVIDQRAELVEVVKALAAAKD